MNQCWKCHKELQLPSQKVSFRAECEHCGAELHCCKGCRHYMIGKPNDCNVPNTDPIKDRDLRNLCEEFDIRPASLAKEGEDPIKKFNSIFKDE